MMQPPAQAPVERHMGRRLYATFVSAGLPSPQLRMDVAIGGGPDFPGYDYLAGSLRILGSLAQQRSGATFPEADDPETPADRLRAEIGARGGVLTLSPVVRAWARKPATDQGAAFATSS